MSDIKVDRYRVYADTQFLIVVVVWPLRVTIARKDLANSDRLTNGWWNLCVIFKRGRRHIFLELPVMLTCERGRTRHKEYINYI